MIYTIEIRKDIKADDDNDAKVEANKIAASIGGYASAVFNESWDEV